MGFSGKLRDMKPQDVDAVYEIEKLCFSRPWSKASFKNELKNELARYLVMTDSQGGVVAYGGMWVILDQAHITNIAVHPDYRRLGLGSYLVRELISRAFEEAVTSLTLEVRVSNAGAIALYKQFGFDESGIRPRYYEDNGEDALIMWNCHPERYLK